MKAAELVVNAHMEMVEGVDMFLMFAPQKGVRGLKIRYGNNLPVKCRLPLFYRLRQPITPHTEFTVSIRKTVLVS